jgi:hypothetical protein
MKSLVIRVISIVSVVILAMCVLSGCALFVRDCGESAAITQKYSTVPNSDVDSITARESESFAP